MAKYEDVINQFPPDIIESLMEFVKYIANLKEDYIVFMARKSYCLYKILTNSSLRPSQKIITSDRIFDLEMPSLVGKGIALVDDTLIIGTTLAEVKSELEDKYNAKVTIHVFSVDDENWVREIIQPDKIFLTMKNSKLMTFCASIIKALYVSAMPYIVDFPISKNKKLNIEQIDAIISCLKYNSFDLTNELQREYNVKYYTLIPECLNNFFNKNINEIIQIIKIRLFFVPVSVNDSSKASNDFDYYLSIVPIVTLKSISLTDLNRLFLDLLSDIHGKSSVNVNDISNIFVSDESKLRLLQYLLSCKLLWKFIHDITPLINENFKIIFNKSETQSHFGIENYDLMNELEVISNILFTPESSYSYVRKAELPFEINSMADDFFCEINHGIDEGVDLYTKFTEIFIKFFEKREMPFREDAKKLGRKILFDNSIKSKDRLKIGLPFDKIEEKLLESSNNTNISFELSMIIDLCNDLGVAVPVTCVKDNIIFRAYRHGEDVKVTQELLSMIYYLIEGYLSSSNKTYITQLPLQKIIVLFIKYGIREKLFMPIRSLNNNKDKLSVEYDLKGAIPRHYFWDDDGLHKNEYFTKYLLRRNILDVQPIEGINRIILGNKNIINEIINANHVKEDAPDKAGMFGDLLGKIIYERKSDEDKPIKTNDLIILSSCDSTLNTLRAIHAEIRIIITWINNRSFETINWDNIYDLKEYYRNTMRANAYEAFNSAKLKYRGYIGNRNKKTIEIVRDYLKSKNDTMSLRLWNSLWKNYSNIKNEDMVKFGDYIESNIDLILKCQLYIKIMLFCIINKLTEGKNIVRNIEVLKRDLVDYIDSINEVSMSPYNYGDTLYRLDKYDSTETPFPYKKTFFYYANKLKELCIEMETKYETHEMLIKNYGTETKRHDYQYMIWYDIIDSTSTNVPNEYLSEHKKGVKLFKNTIPSNLENIQLKAKKENVVLYSQRGDINSDDDGKQIFLSGSKSIRFIPIIFNSLLYNAESFNINIRLLAISTNFVSSPVYREMNHTEVQGSKFFNYFSRVEKEIKKIEAKRKEMNGNENILMILDDNLYKSISFPRSIFFDAIPVNIIVEIEKNVSRFKTVCGSICINKSN